jgi:hypothetical protein
MPSRASTLIAILVLAGLTGLVPARPAAADTLLMQDGRRVHGRLLSVTRGWVEFQPLEGDSAAEPLRVAVAEVRSIRFDDDQDTSDIGSSPSGGGGDRVDTRDPSTAARDRRRRRAAMGRTTGRDTGDGVPPDPDAIFAGRRPSDGPEDADQGAIAPDRDTGPREGGLGPRDGGLARRSAREDGRHGRMITVGTASRWTDSGIDVTSGDVISFSVAGTVTLGDDRPLGAEGDLDGAAVAARRPMPDRPAGALIGRIGTSPDDTFFIGAERLPFRVRTSGRLYLSVNDDTLDDDTGAFQVSITR